MDDMIALLARALGEAERLWSPIHVWGQTHWPTWSSFATDPIGRAILLTALIFPLIWIIAFVYTLSAGSGQYAPIAIRPHVAKRLTRRDISVPKTLLPMNMDGVEVSRCDVFYTFTNRKGDRRRIRVAQLKNLKIHVSPARLGSTQSTIFGYEVPDVPTDDVCFPAFEIQEAPTVGEPTIDRAPIYVAKHKILDGWKEDDESTLVSLSENTLEEIRLAREEYIIRSAEFVKAERERPRLSRIIGPTMAGRLGAKRIDKEVNVIGSYMLRFKFKKDPLFVLSNHPDRDLKMTAWLTVLTSLFSIGMDLWPKNISTAGHSSVATERPTSVPRPIAPRP